MGDRIVNPCCWTAFEMIIESVIVYLYCFCVLEPANSVKSLYGESSRDPQLREIFMWRKTDEGVAMKYRRNHHNRLGVTFILMRHKM